jgi:hypothetical protein
VKSVPDQIAKERTDKILEDYERDERCQIELCTKHFYEKDREEFREKMRKLYLSERMGSGEYCWICSPEPVSEDGEYGCMRRLLQSIHELQVELLGDATAKHVQGISRCFLDMLKVVEFKVMHVPRSSRDIVLK